MSDFVLLVSSNSWLTASFYIWEKVKISQDPQASCYDRRKRWQEQAFGILVAIINKYQNNKSVIFSSRIWIPDVLQSWNDPHTFLMETGGL